MGYSASQPILFSPLPKTRTPWMEFAFGTGTQAAAIAFLVWARLLYPPAIPALEHSFGSVELVSTPVPVNHQPQPLPPVLRAHLDLPPNAIELPAPEPKPRARVEDAAAPTVSIATKKLDSLPLNSATIIPKQAVKTNVFSAGSSAAPNMVRAPSQVQTGGFGDPNGIPAKADQSKAVTIAAAGSFDLPSGAGYGNGTGGTKGATGVVASSSFGNTTATPIHGASAGAVQASGFSTADFATPPTVRSHPAEPTVRISPAEILSKPTPLYTQEAKNLRIEGEVLLEVVLEASGSLHVVRLVRGLGHGLDDNAMKAAEKIHFKPATRDGQPADSTVVLHIIFQLA
jgi:TonB family protein